MKNRLTTLRENAGWTPVELANSVGVTRATITAIENGSYDPSLFLAYDIAEALDARVTELFPPVPRRVRLEGLAARPWYVRLFFD
jgi:putative transcriptional regulator